ncbi:MAG: response regulator transcription factor [Alphaproteobacteria bacterium]|nr:response regulator transcription factor [Alphaproteobacteria bacterium]MBL7097776.1 response regulator transcription factor [Alphaproteobacteria bacterium]
MASKLPKILIVDDEPPFRRVLRTGLPPHGFDCIEAGTAAEALAVFAKSRPDAVILDLGLPDQDGFSLIQKIRADSLTPIVVLSARSDVEGKVKALELGADDYVTKPFDMAELLARLNAALRHGLQAAGETPIFRTGPLSVDLVKRHVYLGTTELHLSPKEYVLLRQLVHQAGNVVTHQQLLKQVWGPANVEDVQYLRVLMGQLRKKIEPGAVTPSLLVTEPGIGYRLLIRPAEGVTPQ